MDLTVEDLLKTQNKIHVFGYGSLTWKPDFEYDQTYLGYIEGYERRFWQASMYHRGTPTKPGRVLTLTTVEEGICWGLVYEITGSEKIEKALDYLQLREQSIGHYEIRIVPVYTQGITDGPLYSLVYYATPKNDLYLGDGPIEKLADDIATSIGKVGHNIEYLFRLTDFMRQYLPYENDEHLFALDKLVRTKVGLCTKHILPWCELMESQRFRSIILGSTSELESQKCLLSPTELVVCF